MYFGHVWLQWHARYVSGPQPRRAGPQVVPKESKKEFPDDPALFLQMQVGAVRTVSQFWHVTYGLGMFERMGFFSCV